MGRGRPGGPPPFRGLKGLVPPRREPLPRACVWRPRDCPEGGPRARTSLARARLTSMPTSRPVFRQHQKKKKADSVEFPGEARQPAAQGLIGGVTWGVRQRGARLTVLVELTDTHVHTAQDKKSVPQQTHAQGKTQIGLFTAPAQGDKVPTATTGAPPGRGAKAAFSRPFPRPPFKPPTRKRTAPWRSQSMHSPPPPRPTVTARSCGPWKAPVGDERGPGKTFQNRSVSSPAPVTIVSPVGLTARYSTRHVWPVRVTTGASAG